MVVLSGIYPPDSGGPATFSVAFSDFVTKNHYFSKVLSLTDSVSTSLKSDNQEVKLISRRLGLLRRTVKVVLEVASEFARRSHVIANGFFIETYLASILTRGSYVAKVPGDIVWERATNSSLTSLSVGDFQKEKLSFKYKIFRSLFSRSLIRAKSVIVPSPVLYQLCLSWGVPRGNLHMIFNSVDVDYFKPSSNAHLKHDCIVVNRLVKLKNVDEVIRACHARNLSLLVVGDGPEMENLISLSTSLQSKTTFAGNTSKQELLDYLQSSSFYILNSTVDATAYSLLEARSCGLIAIANVETGASQVIRHKVDGYLTDTTDSIGLEKALEWLSQRTHEEIQNMRQDSRESTMLHFNKDLNFKRILKMVVS